MSVKYSMKNFAKKVVRFLASEDGPTAVEYALMLCLILLAALAAIVTFGEATNTCFEYSRDEINNAIRP
jgi:pilus assembly protein Flp/PilA